MSYTFEHLDMKKNVILENDNFDWIWDLEELKENKRDYEKFKKIKMQTIKTDIIDYIKNKLNITIPKQVFPIIEQLSRTSRYSTTTKKGDVYENDDYKDFKYAFDDKGMFYDQYYDKLNFIKEIIEKYELDAFQITVLLINVDLIYSMYYEYKAKQIYNTEYPLLYTNITEKIINNLKLLVNNDFFYNLTINQLTSLQNNLILFQDNNEFLKKYQNINNYDLIKLTFLENNLANEYISILNNFDEESKNMILDLIQPLKNSADLFPNIIEDITFDNNGFSSKFEEIINNNKYAFENFNTFFTNNFNLDFIKQIENRQDKIDILKILLTLKKTFLKKIPEKIDTRYSYITYDYETISEKDCNGCWEDVEIVVPVRVEGGFLDYKEELVNNYADLIIKIKDIIMNNNDINLNEFVEANINNENRDFLTNFIYEYCIKENKQKTKKYLINK